MKKGMLITGTILLLATASRAQTTYSTNYVAPPAEPRYDDRHHDEDQDYEDLYRPMEFSIEGFAGLTLDKDTIDNLSLHRVEDHGHVGGGAGANFFFTRWFGVGGEAYTESTDRHAVDSAAGHAYLRFPIDGTGLAPYAFGGGGHIWDPIGASEGHAGAGLEFRFLRNVGIFVDGRWEWTDRLGNFGMGRLGMRIAF